MENKYLVEEFEIDGVTVEILDWDTEFCYYMYSTDCERSKYTKTPTYAHTSTGHMTALSAKNAALSDIDAFKAEVNLYNIDKNT